MENIIHEIEAGDIKTFSMTPERLREIALHHMVTSGPGLDQNYMPTSAELTVISDMLYTAVIRGQVIDFGHWPNEMIKATAKRAGPLYIADGLAHPFSSPYVIMHSWDIPKYDWVTMNLSGSSVYLINPFPQSNATTCIDFEALEFEGLLAHGSQCVGVMDRVAFHAKQSQQTGGYSVNVTPFAMRYHEKLNDPHVKEILHQSGETIYEGAVSNVLDPLMTGLMILNTRNMPRNKVVASEKLNRSRVKRGKPMIPPYDRIDSSPYVTAILARQERVSGSHGGTACQPYDAHKTRAHSNLCIG